jgi:hypothetical protein
VAPDHPSELSLTEVIREAELTAHRVNDDELKQIAVRFVVPGMRGVMGQLAREHETSYSDLTRHALDHGIQILDSLPWIGALHQGYDQLRYRAMSTGDEDALARLGQTGRYELQRSQEDRTTFSVHRETLSKISSLAVASGIHVPPLAVVLVAISVVTLPNNRGYRKWYIAEVKAFRRFVDHRTQILLLPDRSDQSYQRKRGSLR